MKNFDFSNIKNIIVIIFITVITSTPLLFSSIKINAQEVNEIVLDPSAPESEQVDVAPEIEDTNDLKIDFKQFTQDPETKIAKFEMTVMPTFDSDRVQINWIVSGTSKPVDETKLEIKRTTIKKGGSYKFSIEVKPTGLGISEVYGKVTAVKVDGSIVSTVRKNFVTSKDLDILPITNEYKTAQTTNLIVRIVTIIVIVLVAVVGGLFGLRWFIRWLNKFDKSK